MIAVASVRFSGTQAHLNTAQSWDYFWIETEACVAVWMVSLSAFRSVFASDERRARSKKVRPWYSSTVARLRNAHKFSEGADGLKDLPTVPSATLSGMRTYIRVWGSDLGTTQDDECCDRKSLGEGLS